MLTSLLNLYFSPIMKKVTLFLAALLTTVLSGSVSAQTIPLDQMLKLSTLASDLPFEKMTPLLLPAGWVYRGHLKPNNEAYWTANTTDYDFDSETEPATSWVSLRPMPSGVVDVVFKTKYAANYDHMRRELKKLKLPVIPVTCLECEGERHTGPNYTFSFYSGKKGEYAYMIVLHTTPVPAALARPAAATLPLAVPGELPTTDSISTAANP